MVAKRAAAAGEEQGTREALAAAIAEAAERELAGWGDERLLGQARARVILRVKRVVRVHLGRTAPEMVAGVTSWRLHRLLDEIVPGEVGRAQFGAFERELTAIYGPIEGDTFDPSRLSGPINGVYIYDISPREEEASGDEAWTAGE